MNRKRLQDLRDLMVKHRESGGTNTPINGTVCSFDIRVWQEHSECGTTACVYGTWLLSPHNDGPYTVTKNGDIKDTNTGEYRNGFHAAAEDFDLPLGKAHYIFDYYYYAPFFHNATEDMINAVINRIDDLLF